ncbi:MAG TPA: LytTR family DNA-binding domain-containing protein, partial [Burkholderiaceae bacterium]|nr:LytTR family DNA-binding domain-containing protein [Burkholderiaceae bacterium]
MSTDVATALKVLIVDDEELARLRLRSLVADNPEPRAQVVGEAANAAQALAHLAERACDVVLLDIQMPGRDGMQLAVELRAMPQPPAIVFVTAHAEHALRAFELEALDYLTKPVKRERLQAALQRVAQRLNRPPAPPPAEPAEAPVIIVSDRGRIVRVPVAEVLYLKAELKYVTLRTAAHTHVLDDSLADLEGRLGERFLRVHRNALVARHAVRALERRVVAGEGDDEGGEVWAVRIA